MKLATKREMNQLDQDAMSQYGIPSLLLMEHAAYGVFYYLMEEHQGKSVTILCGPGNNGGDGLALARILYSFKKAQVQVVLLMEEEKLSSDGKVYYTICEKLGIPIYHYLEERELVWELIEEAQVLVDAIFGTGLTRPITGSFYKVIEKVNASSAFKVSVDIPSGIHPDTADVLGIAVEADCTLTFQLPKVGQFLYPGIAHRGTLRVVDIGIPKELVSKMSCMHYAIDEDMAKGMLPNRPIRSNKGTYGKVLMIGGQVGMGGAICLASKAVMQVGAGLVTIAVPNALALLTQQKVTEAITLSLPERDGHLDETAATILKEHMMQYSTIGIGPGISRNGMIQKIMEVVLESDKPIVVDADGLYALKPYLNQLKARKAPIIITPHPGEMSYLSGESIADILAHPVESARSFSERYGIIVVLKIERMIVAVPDGSIYINSRGHSAIAKGGAGDVLTGFITGLLAQNKQPVSAALLGCYLHADTACSLARLKGSYSVLPSDLIEHVGESFKGLENKH